MKQLQAEEALKEDLAEGQKEDVVMEEETKLAPVEEALLTNMME